MYNNVSYDDHGQSWMSMYVYGLAWVSVYKLRRLCVIICVVVGWFIMCLVWAMYAVG